MTVVLEDFLEPRRLPWRARLGRLILVALGDAVVTDVLGFVRKLDRQDEVLPRHVVDV